MLNLWPADFWNVDHVVAEHGQSLLRQAEAERRVRDLRAVSRQGRRDVAPASAAVPVRRMCCEA